MKLTKQKAIELHRELWDWLYHHPAKGKRNWPRWECNDGDIPDVRDECFLCEYRQFKKPCCLLDWPLTIEYGSDVPCCNSYFGQWGGAKTPKTRKKYAKLIRDLKERE